MHSHHAIDYVEFSGPDLAGAKRFYASAFGWQFTDYGPEYAGVSVGGREIGGLFEANEIRTTGPLVVLYSNNLEQSLKAVEAAGGSIVKEPFSFPGGRRLHFADPGGNELAVWSEVG